MKKIFWKNKRVLVTGADGFVGPYFLAMLLSSEATVFGSVLKKGKSDKKQQAEIVELDVLDKEKLMVFCRKKKINFIIHCAVVDGNAEFKEKEAARIIRENIKMTANVLNVARVLGIKELIIFSSAQIYAANLNGSIKEEDDYTKSFPELDNAYAAAKISTEILARLYQFKFGLKILLPRPTNSYGPEIGISVKSNRVIARMIERIMSGQEIEIWGDGRQTRSFIYITDFISSIIRLVENGNYGVFNIATNENISIKDLAELIARLSGRKLRIKFTKAKMGGARKRFLNIVKLNQAIDFKPLSLEAGLKKTIVEYKKKYL